MAEEFKPDEYTIMSNAPLDAVKKTIIGLGYEQNELCSEVEYFRGEVPIKIREPWDGEIDVYASEFDSYESFVEEQRVIIYYFSNDWPHVTSSSSDLFEEDLDTFNSPLMRGLEALLSGDEEQMEESLGNLVGLGTNEKQLREVGKAFEEIARNLRNEGYEVHFYGARGPDNKREYKTFN